MEDSVQPHVPATLPLGENAQYQQSSRLLQSRSSSGVREKSLTGTRIKPLTTQITDLFSHTKQRATVRTGITVVHKYQVPVYTGV